MIIFYLPRKPETASYAKPQITFGNVNHEFTRTQRVILEIDMRLVSAYFGPASGADASDIFDAPPELIMSA